MKSILTLLLFAVCAGVLAEARADEASAAKPTSVQSEPPRGNRAIRLAIGGLGLPEEERNGRLGDLILVQLASVEGLELVERQSLAAALHETALSLSGLVHAKEAVQVGHLLHADWFLLGSPVGVNGTNSVFARIVDVRSGAIRSMAVFLGTPDLPGLARQMAEFVVRSQREYRSGQSPVYMAIGSFQDIGINNRFAAFPGELRSYLAGAFQSSSVVVLEREAVTPLLQELRMELGGLVQAGATTNVAASQAAFWMVDGFYQSYELSGPEIDLVLRVQHVLGPRQLISLREKPGKELLQQAREAVAAVLAKGQTLRAPQSAQSEIELQMARGRQLLDMEGRSLILLTPTDQAVVGGLALRDPIKKRRNIEDAINAFEAVLLLDPENREAKMRMATCLRYGPLARLDEARSYYREIIASEVKDGWSDEARLALAFSYSGLDNPRKLDLFQTFAAQCSSPRHIAMCRDGARSTLQDLVSSGAVPTEKLLPYVDEDVFQNLEAVAARAKTESEVPAFSFGAIQRALRFDEQAVVAHLNRLLPKLEKQFPELTPYLLVECLWYQTDPESPMVQEFRQSLDSCLKHPEQVLHGSSYPRHLRWRWALNHQLYDLAVQIADARLGATPGGWQSLDEARKVEVAYVYLGAQRWKEALEIFESFGPRTVDVGNLSQGPWGSPFEPFVPALKADECRAHLGLPKTQTQMPARFELGQPFLTTEEAVAYLPEGNVLWLADRTKLYLCDSSGNKVVKASLPLASGALITAIAAGPETLWLGTRGHGLLAFNRATGAWRHWTERDGLLLDDVTYLLPQRHVLWIGFGHHTSGDSGYADMGGLGQMDLKTGRLMALTGSLAGTAEVPRGRAGNAADPSEGPPRHRVVGITEGPSGELWVAVWEKGLQRYDPATDTWETRASSDRLNHLSCLAADQLRLVAGCFSNSSRTPGSTNGGLSLYSFAGRDWQRMFSQNGLPSNDVTTVALAGHEAWIAGNGYLAVLNLDQMKLERVCYIRSTQVSRIKIVGDSAWIRAGLSLYRLPLHP
jgi:hypothetical protein